MTSSPAESAAAFSGIRVPQEVPVSLFTSPEVVGSPATTRLALLQLATMS